MTLRISLSTLAVSGAICAGMLMVEGCAKKAVAVAKPATAEPRAAQPVEAARTPAQPKPAAQPTRQAAVNNTPRTPDQATQDRIQALLNRIQDAYFDYNTSNIRADAMTALRSDAETLSEILKDYPTYKLTIEGYCDERGSAEYNLALGQQRAERARDFLTTAGIPSTQLVTVSYGKERQLCTEQDEACWQKNRRIHITQKQPGQNS